MARRALLPAVRAGSIYGASVGTLFVAELILSRRAGMSGFGEYQLVRQAIPLILLISLIGVDQSLIRVSIENGSTSRFVPHTKAAALLSLAWGAIAGFALHRFFRTDPLTTATVTIAPALVAVSELGAAALRVNRKYAASAVLQQGYRLCAALILLGSMALTNATSSSDGVIALAIGSLIACACGCLALTKNAHTATSLSRRVYTMGLGFAVSGLPFAAIDWLDQALLSWKFNNLAAGGQYATSKLCIVYPAITLASVLGFTALPEAVRLSKTLPSHVLKKTNILALLTLIPLTLLFYIVYLMSDRFLFDTQASPTAALLLAATGSIRVAYVVPSALLGSISSSRRLMRTSILSLGSIALLTASILTLPIENSVTLGAVSLLFATLFRYLVALVSTHRAIGEVQTRG